MVWLAWVGVVVRAACPADASGALRSASSKLLDAYARVEAEAFSAAAGEVDDAIPCIRVVISPHEAAEIHRTMALIAFVRGQVEAARGSLDVARSLDPAWVLPEDLFPQGHPIRSLYEAARRPEGAEPLVEAETNWWVDGLASDVAPLDHPFVLQATGEHGEVLWTGYLRSIVEVPSLGPPDLGVVQAQLLFALRGTVRALRVNQDVTDPVLEAGTTEGVGGGLDLDLAWTPTPWAGLSVQAEGALGGDPRVDLPLGRLGASALVGWHRVTVDHWWGAYVTPGLRLEQVAAWGAGDTTLLYALPSPTVGLVVDGRWENALASAGVDLRWPGGVGPAAWSGDVDVGARVLGSLAVSGGLGVDHRAVGLSTGAKTEGRRTEDALQARLGLAVWR